VFKEAAGNVMRSLVKDGYLKGGHEKNFKLSRVKPDLPFKAAY